MRKYQSDAGFTLTELMVTVGIVGIMAGIATPYLGKDRMAREGREFASELARDLTRSKQQSIADRLPIRAFVFSDRVEFRSSTAGATLGAPPVPPTMASPILRVLRAKAGVTIFDMVPMLSPPGGQVLNTATPKIIEFSIMGQAQFIGQPPITGAFLYVRNGQLAAGHLERDFRIDVTPLTGYVSLVERWY